MNVAHADLKQRAAEILGVEYGAVCRLDDGEAALEEADSFWETHCRWPSSRAVSQLFTWFKRLPDHQASCIDHKKWAMLLSSARKEQQLFKRMKFARSHLPTAHPTLILHRNKQSMSRLRLWQGVESWLEVHPVCDARRCASGRARRDPAARASNRVALCIRRWRQALQLARWSEDVCQERRAAFPRTWACLDIDFWAGLQRQVLQYMVDDPGIGSGDEAEHECDASDSSVAECTTAEGESFGAASDSPLLEPGHLRVARDISHGNDSALQTLRDRVCVCVAEYAQRVVANFHSLSSGIFVAVQSDMAVHQAALTVFGAYSLTAEYRKNLRSFVRQHVLEDTDADWSLRVMSCLDETGRGNKFDIVDASFFHEPAQDQLVDMDIRMLIVTASGERCARSDCLYGAACERTDTCIPADLRARAIRWLLKYFPGDAQEAGREFGVDASQNGVYDWWQEKLAQAEAEGKFVQRRVCHLRACQVRCELRSDGRTLPFIPPLLPVLGGDNTFVGGTWCSRLSSFQHTTASDRLGGRSHGSAICWLPADFLCPQCLHFFRSACLKDCPETVQRNFCDQLCLRRDLDLPCAIEELEFQQLLLLKRDQILSLAHEGKSTEFVSLLCECRKEFATGRVTRNLLSVAVKALPHVLYCKGMDSADSTRDFQFFGFQEVHGRVYSSALAIHQCPAFWTHYSGSPGFCCEQVWSLRALARATGGFSCLPRFGTYGSQEQLLLSEAAQNPSFTFYDLCGKWVSALDLKPAGPLPSAAVWLQILSERPQEQVLSIRERILAERSRAGLIFRRGQWHFDTIAVMRQAQQCGDLTAKEIELLGNFDFFERRGDSERQFCLESLTPPAARRMCQLHRAWELRTVGDWCTCHGEKTKKHPAAEPDAQAVPGASQLASDHQGREDELPQFVSTTKSSVLEPEQTCVGGLDSIPLPLSSDDLATLGVDFLELLNDDDDDDDDDACCSRSDAKGNYNDDDDDELDDEHHDDDGIDDDEHSDDADNAEIDNEHSVDNEWGDDDRDVRAIHDQADDDAAESVDDVPVRDLQYAPVTSPNNECALQTVPTLTRSAGRLLAGAKKGRTRLASSRRKVELPPAVPLHGNTSGPEIENVQALGLESDVAEKDLAPVGELDDDVHCTDLHPSDENEQRFKPKRRKKESDHGQGVNACPSEAELDARVELALLAVHVGHEDYDEKKGSWDVFFAKFQSQNPQFKARSRAWAHKLREAVQRVLRRHRVSTLCVDCPASKLSLNHQETRRAIGDVLLRHDLRTETTSSSVVRCELASALGISEAALMSGLRLQEEEPADKDWRL